MGRVFDVELRLHSFFVMLLFLALVWTSMLGLSPGRGLMLWLLLLLAVAVRELARALVSIWYGLEPRRLLLLPTGGVTSYATPEATERATAWPTRRAMAIAGPVASFLAGLTAAALVLAVAPRADLTTQSWVSPAHLVRALVWMNLLLAAVNLLPAWPLDMGRLLHGEAGPGSRLARPVAGTDARLANGRGAAPAGGLAGRLQGMRAVAGMGLAIAAGLMVAGVMTKNMWLIMASVAILLGARLERRGVMLEATADRVQVREVMLEEYSTLSASATLEDAVEHARHTLQDVFPVVRGGVMVGAVARQSVLTALEANGNGYVQGIMTREFQTASPEDSLVATLGRITGAVGLSSQLVVVMEPGGVSDKVLGIITPQNLQRSMGLLARRTTLGGSSGRAETD